MREFPALFIFKLRLQMCHDIIDFSFPEIFPKLVTIQNVPRVVMLAKVAINIGDEITYDYEER